VRWTIGRRLAALGIVAIFSTVIVGLIGVREASSSNTRAERAFEVAKALSLTIDAQHTASVVLADASILTGALTAERRTQIIEQMTEHAGELEKQVAGLGALKLSGDLGDALAVFLPTTAPVLEDAAHLTTMTGRTSPKDFDTVQSHWDQLDEASDGLKSLLSERSAQTTAETSAANGTTRTTLLIITLISAAAVTGLVWLVARQVAPPIRTTRRLLEAVATGDFTGRVPAASRDDLGDMGRALNSTVENVGRAIHDISANARVLSESASNLTDVSQQLADGAKRTAAEAGAASHGATEVNQDVRAIAERTDEMRQSIEAIARNAAVASEIVATAVNSAAGATSTVSKLATSSDQIGQVAKTIASIAEQTNLLALNATIEAARAGEAGKGFAVVAGEVKELASETARATEDIARQITALQSDSSDVAAGIGNVSTTINEISDIQLVIAAAVEQQSASTAEIGGRVQRAAERTTDIAERVSVVTSTSQEATDSAARTKQAATDLAATASDLQTIVARFRLGDEASA
jgi:methyl-accepting chemotaxis protein